MIRSVALQFVLWPAASTLKYIWCSSSSSYRDPKKGGCLCGEDEEDKGDEEDEGDEGDEDRRDTSSNVDTTHTLGPPPPATAALTPSIAAKFTSLLAFAAALAAAQTAVSAAAVSAAASWAMDASEDLKKA